MITSTRIAKDNFDMIRNELRKDYNPTIFMIRARCRETLGFTVREGGYGSPWVDLDWYDEASKTMFLLRFGHLVSSKTARA